MAKNLTVSLPVTFTALQHRNFRRYWLGNMVSFIGTWMQNTAKGWLVLSITNSPFFVGLDSTLSWLAVWFVSLPAGVLADRLNKRNLMILAQSGLAFFALLLALLTWLKLITIAHILIISGLTGIFAAINAPVAQTLIPELVGRKDALNAIALNYTVFNLARIIGPALAGIFLTFTGPAVCFAINSASFLAIIIALFFIKLNTPPPQIEETFLKRLGSGLKFVKSHPDIRLLMIMTGVFSSFGICYLPLMPVIARDVFGLGSRGYGFLLSALGLGAITGGLTLATLSRTPYRGKLLIAGTALLSLLLILFSFVRTTIIGLILFIIIGFCQAGVVALTNTLIQTLSPDAIRGRAIGVFNIFYHGMFPVGSLIAGAIAQTKGAPFALLISGIVVLTVLLTVTALRPQLQRL